MTPYDRIYELCKEHDLPVTALEEKLGFSRGSIGKMKIHGAVPRAERIQKIADYFHVTSDYIMTGASPDDRIPKNVYKVELKPFPMLGEIACGTPKYTEPDRGQYVMSDGELHADFCLKVTGDSMINANIRNGDIVFCAKQEMVENGEIAAVVVNSDSEATLKRLYYYRDRAVLVLRAENPQFEDLIFQGEELGHVHILGKAIAVQTNIR